MKKTAIGLLLSILLPCFVTSCYHRRPDTPDAFVQEKNFLPMDEHMLDSLSFQSIHHYTNNFNFVVTSDSLCLLRQQPEEYLSGMPTDTFFVYKHDPLVVADIRILPVDSVDSVWVELARDQLTFGWTRECELLSHVSPDDPISEFITFFSDIHLIVFLVVIVLIGALYWLRMLLKKNVPVVHFRDINSFYPTVLALTVAASASFYASIQLFAPEMWRHFYYHPTLNPFTVPPLICIFLLSVWAILIIAVAAIDDVFRLLPVGEAALYLSGLLAVCAYNYILFSLSTLYYIGYPLLAVYVFYAVRNYFQHHRVHYQCGKCGKPIHSKGVCPYCGAQNE